MKPFLSLAIALLLATATWALEPNQVIPRVSAAFDLDVPPGPYEVRPSTNGEFAYLEVLTGSYRFNIYPESRLVSFNARRFPRRTAPGETPPAARFTRAQLEAKAERAFRAMGYGRWFDEGMQVKRHVDRNDPALGETAEAAAGLAVLSYAFPDVDGWAIGRPGLRGMMSTGDGRFYAASFFLDKDPPERESVEGVISPLEAARTALRELRTALDRNPGHTPPDVWPTAAELAAKVHRALAVSPSGPPDALGFSSPPPRALGLLRAQYTFHIGERRLWGVTVGAHDGRVYGAALAGGRSTTGPTSAVRAAPAAEPQQVKASVPAPGPAQGQTPWVLFVAIGLGSAALGGLAAWAWRSRG